MRDIQRIWINLRGGPFTVRTAEKSDAGTWMASPIPMAGNFATLDEAEKWLQDEAEYMGDDEIVTVAVCDDRPKIVAIYRMGDIVQ